MNFFSVTFQSRFRFELGLTIVMWTGQGRFLAASAIRLRIRLHLIDGDARGGGFVGFGRHAAVAKSDDAARIHRTLAVVKLTLLRNVSVKRVENSDEAIGDALGSKRPNAGQRVGEERDKGGSEGVGVSYGALNADSLAEDASVELSGLGLEEEFHGPERSAVDAKLKATSLNDEPILDLNKSQRQIHQRRIFGDQLGHLFGRHHDELDDGRRVFALGRGHDFERLDFDAFEVGRGHDLARGGQHLNGVDGRFRRVHRFFHLDLHGRQRRRRRRRLLRHLERITLITHKNASIVIYIYLAGYWTSSDLKLRRTFGTQIELQLKMTVGEFKFSVATKIKCRVSVATIYIFTTFLLYNS